MNMDNNHHQDLEEKELVIIVDSENQEQMIVSRSLMREQNLIHRSTFIAVLNNDDKILVMQRSLSKDLYPGAYEICCAGVVHPYESYEECGLRELHEELGIRRPPLSFVDLFYDENQHNRVWGCLYKTRWTGELRFAQDEVAWGTFLDFHEVQQLINQGKCTPESSFILEMIKESV